MDWPRRATIGGRFPKAGDASPSNGGRTLFRPRELDLRRRWSEVSFRMQELRDNPACARQE
jgi:hypothetical protein